VAFSEVNSNLVVLGAFSNSLIREISYVGQYIVSPLCFGGLGSAFHFDGTGVFVT
jgi:hypothetical protein